MTEKEFKECNQPRAVTLKNLINRHGEEKDREMWENYKAAQKKTKSWDYMVEKFGEDKAREINKSKAITESTTIRKHGEKIG